MAEGEGKMQQQRHEHWGRQKVKYIWLRFTIGIFFVSFTGCCLRSLQRRGGRLALLLLPADLLPGRGAAEGRGGDGGPRAGTVRRPGRRTRVRGWQRTRTAAVDGRGRGGVGRVGECFFASIGIDDSRRAAPPRFVPRVC